jgi:hypothetical protein
MSGPMTTAVLPLAGLPEQCPECGHGPDVWPLGVYGGRLNVTCPACHSIVTPVVAVKPRKVIFLHDGPDAP